MWHVQRIGSFFLWLWVFVLAGVISLAGLVLFLPFRPWVDPKRGVMEWLSGLWGKGVMRVLPGIDLEVSGLEYLRNATEPFVIVPNHSSVADVIVLLAVFPHFKFISKMPFFWLPPLA